MKIIDQLLTDAFKSLLTVRYDIHRAENTAELARIKADCEKMSRHIVARANPQIRQFCPALQFLCNYAMNLLEDRKFQQAFDFIDAFHGLPLIFLKNRYSVPEKFFTVYADPYSRKWGPEFEARFRDFFRTVPNTPPTRSDSAGK